MATKQEQQQQQQQDRSRNHHSSAAQHKQQQQQQQPPATRMMKKKPQPAQRSNSSNTTKSSSNNNNKTKSSQLRFLGAAWLAPAVCCLVLAFQTASQVQPLFEPPSSSLSAASQSNGQQSVDQKAVWKRALPVRWAGQQEPQMMTSQSQSQPQQAAQQQQQQQQQAVQQQQQQQSVSNIEMLMKNALARTAQLNSAASETRQENSLQPAPKLSQSEQAGGASNQRPGMKQQQQQQQGEQQNFASAQATAQRAAKEAAAAAAAASAPAADTSDRSAESSNITADVSAPSTASGAGAGSEETDKQTTSAQPTTMGVHETVYSDPRFANLFARRNANKTRITPSEQVKAKPTLPSFIKSLPDPKQFTSAQANTQDGNGRSATPSSFTSLRIQQQNQGRGLNQPAIAPKKPAITSNSAATANNRRVNANANKPSPAPPKPSASNPKPTPAPNKPASVAPSVNNPFNRIQGSNSDPANVIAIARKRLLANNALESAKLKQKQATPN